MQKEFLEVCPTSYHRLTEELNRVWGWEIVVYLFLGGMVAGLLILTAALELRRGDHPRSPAVAWMPVAAIGLISLGMVALFLDLHHKIHFYRFYLAFKPASPMSWGAWILLVIYPAAILLALGSMAPAWRERLRGNRLVSGLRLRGLFDWAVGVADRHRRTVLWTSIGVGIGLGIYTGLLLGTMVARIQWNSAVLGPLFLASGVSTGAAFMLLFRLTEHEQHALVRWDVLAIAVELFFLALMLIGFANGNEAAQTAGANLLGGPWTALFWTLVVGVGLLVPLLMEIFEISRGLRLALVTPAMILVGGVALRAILLASGQESCFCALR
jgi:formate-dependent nitrite reductase membrane component NrfD